MEVNDASLSALSAHLQATLNPDPNTRRPAEQLLRQLGENEGYAVLLLAFVENASIGGGSFELKVAAAIAFKNFVKREWKILPDTPSHITANERELIKQRLVQLMLHSNESVQRQLGEAIALIGLEDFPHQWQSLLPTLIDQFSGNNYAMINSCLTTANSLFRRYRFESPSAELWTEIKYVLGAFAQPLTDLFARIMQAATTMTHASATELTPLWTCIQLILQVFYSLNAQDLPEFFEDNITLWMPGMLQLLKLEPATLKTSDDDDAGLIEAVRSQVCDCVSMYAEKYDEEFTPYVSQFVECIWTLLVTTGGRPKYDMLIANAIQFLSRVANKQQNKAMFSDQAILKQVCECVVVPNMQLRESDTELFDDNPDEYMRKDIEGNDVDTRRRASADFVRSLCKYFESEVITIFRQYVESMLASYTAHPSTQWQQKELSIYLIMSLAVRGQTARAGVTSTTHLINIVDFYTSHIEPELLSANVNERPLLRASCLKFLITFRTQLPSPLVQRSLAPCIAHLTSDSVVVRSYAAHAIERFCFLRNESGELIFPIEHLHANATQLFTNLFTMLTLPGTELSDYGIKCIMRIIHALKHTVLPYTEHIVNALSGKLIEVAKNPSRPHFNHYLFECYCVIIRVVHTATQQQGSNITSTEAIVQFESALFPPFHQILQLDVSEFLPYVFQILGMMLDMREPNIGIPGPYAELLPFLVIPALWERGGTVRSLVALLRAYIRVSAEDVVKAKQLPPILGVFQKLVVSRQNDIYGFGLLHSLIQYMPWAHMQSNMKPIWNILFTRLQSPQNKTAKFAKGMLIALCAVCVKYGAKAFVEQMENIQTGMFAMVLEKVLIRESAKVATAHRRERKMVCVAFMKLLTDAADNVSCNYSRPELWRALLSSIVQLLSSANDTATLNGGGGGVKQVDASTEEDDYVVDVGTAQDNDNEYTGAHSQLAYAGDVDAATEVFDYTGIDDVSAYLLRSLETLSSKEPTHFVQLLNGADDVCVQFLQTSRVI